MRVLLAGFCLCACPEMYDAEPFEVGRTFWESEGVTYGAKADSLGPLGGGRGYERIVRDGDVRTSTLDQLIEALGGAGPGQTVFVDGNARIDCTARVFVEGLVLQIPAGVTLASDRGAGDSEGALIFSDALATRPLIRAQGPGVRITGLRLRGPDPERRLDHHRRSFAENRGHSYYYKFPVSDGIAAAQSPLEVDNCELAGWSHAAVALKAGEAHHIHHNYIHHNQYNGLGYGISLDQAHALIEANLFNWNRHSIAGTGRPPCGYEARNNVELGESLSHCFDMHGGRDRRDGTDIAGARIHIHHNTFRSAREAVCIRGVPQEEARIHHNWFFQGRVEEAVHSGGNTRVSDNALGLETPCR